MEDQVKQIMQQNFAQMLRENLMSFSNTVVPQHRHNKVDSPAITMGDLLLDKRGLIFPFSNGKVSIVSDNFGLGFVNYNPITDFTIGEADTSSYSKNIYPFNDINLNVVHSIEEIVQNTKIFYTGLSGTLNVGDSINQGSFSGIIIDISGPSTFLIETTDPFITGSFTTSGGASGTISTIAGQIIEITIEADGITTEITGEGTNIVENLGLEGVTYSSTAPGDFAIQLPDNTTRPSQRAGMISFEGGVFYACADGVNWQVISLI